MCLATGNCCRSQSKERRAWQLQVVRERLENKHVRKVRVQRVMTLRHPVTKGYSWKLALLTLLWIIFQKNTLKLDLYIEFDLLNRFRTEKEVSHFWKWEIEFWEWKIELKVYYINKFACARSLVKNIHLIYYVMPILPLPQLEYNPLYSFPMNAGYNKFAIFKKNTITSVKYLNEGVSRHM